VLQEEDEIAF